MAFVSLGASLPDFEVSIDFDNDPTSTTRTWTDVTPYVRRFSISRGRSSELDAAQPGRLVLELDNRDRRFDPTYTSSPYSPNVKTMRRVRVRYQWDGVVYNRFHGYIESWPQQWPDDGGFDAITTVEASDAFKVLSLYDLVGKSYSSQDSGSRLGSVHADVGFGTAELDFETGKSTIAASGTFTSSSALAHVQQVAVSENGVYFANGGGTLVFQNRHHRITSESTATGTIGDAAGEIRPARMTADYSEETLWNKVMVTPDGGTAETAIDTASTASYYTRTLSRDYLITSPSEARDAANYLKARYSEPALRVSQVEVVGAAGTALWSTILGLEISNRVTRRRRPPGGGTISGDDHIELIADDAAVGSDLRIRFGMSPAEAQAFWVLGDANNSVLGTSTRLAY